MAFRSLDTNAVAGTIARLCRRVDHRFPDSGLAHVCHELNAIAQETRSRVERITRPMLGLRMGSVLMIALLLSGLGVTLYSLRLPREGWTVPQFIQVFESGINDLVLVGAVVVFLLTVETRVKRRRALAAFQELRSIAHVIDMHQLTKDPEWLLGRGKESGLVSTRTMTPFELSRYLDYCSEALSLTSKIAGIYVSNFDDPVALTAVREIEDLTSGLSQKIWQKLMILHIVHGNSAPGAEARSVAPEGA
jgi:hypothetical protein